MDYSRTNPPTPHNIQVCALKYRSPGVPIESAEGKIILLAVMDTKNLTLFVHRSLRQLVSEQELEYIEELIEDLADRLRELPEDVFQQLSHLSVGPVFTGSVEWIEGEWLESQSFKDEYSPYDESEASVDTLSEGS